MRHAAPLLLMPILVSCAAVGALTSAISGAIDDEVRADIEAYPFMACAFDAPMDDIREAMIATFKDGGFDVTQIIENEVYLAPVNVTKIDTEIGAGERWQMEEMHGLVYDMAGEHVAYLTYQVGVSTSDKHLVEAYDPMNPGATQHTTPIRKEAEYYGDLMAQLAKRLDQPACGA